MLLRTIALTIQNERRLLFRDPVVLLMLLCAPVVIITVAGYSLGALYGGGTRTFTVPVVDHDGDRVASELIAALRREPSLRVEVAADLDQARDAMRRHERAPVAIEIPAGTTRAIADGRSPALVLYVDPARRIEVDAFELALNALWRRAAVAAQARAQRRLRHSARDLERKVERVAAGIERERARVRVELARMRTETTAAVRAELGRLLEQATRDVESAVRVREEEAWAELQRQLAGRAAVLERVREYVRELESSQRGFADWLARLQALAGSHAADIPPPPSFPPAPPASDLDALTRPITRPDLALSLRQPSLPGSFAVKLAPPPSIEHTDPVPSLLAGLRGALDTRLPGVLGFVQRPASEGAAVVVNAFDQYVPGFGVTFLLIGMMLGLSLTLSDEREWGTTKRLQASGAPLAGMLIGKVTARAAVGVVQMVVLFAVGWALFDISLGREPAALLLPTLAMSFAAAALGLLIPTVAHAHDSVMPLGTMISLAVSAIGGCWWPIDFEPAWMRAIAGWLPTTWTMQAYNDLMIRGLPPSVALTPFAVTVALGTAFLVVGVLALLRVDD